MKSHAKVVIVGGGIMGVSLLYHLTKEGWNDIVLVEKGELTSGSTWHAAGQCPHMIGSYNLAKVHLHSTNLYKQLEKETGQATGFHDCGSLRLAYKKEDIDWFHYIKGILDNVGAPAEIISTEEIKKICLANYGVGFITSSPMSVKGEDAHPIYKWINKEYSKKPKWNFYKFLFDRDGLLVDSWSSMTKPSSKKITNKIDKLI